MAAERPRALWHTAEDLFQYVTPDYTARVAQVVGAVAASLGRAGAPASIAGTGNAAGPALTWMAPSTGAVDHFVVCGPLGDGEPLSFACPRRADVVRAASSCTYDP